MKKLTDKQIEKIDEDFNDMLNTMTGDEFWAWVRTWYDQALIVDSALNWDIEDKQEAIQDFIKQRNEKQ